MGDILGLREGERQLKMPIEWRRTQENWMGKKEKW
jgi:hypothetical protein